MIDLDTLKNAAELATVMPWESSPSEIPHEHKKAFRDACSPDVVLKLIADARRYRWLRDKSEPGICAFYLSVGEAFKGVRFTRQTVDEAIDAQIDAVIRKAEGKTP